MKPILAVFHDPHEELGTLGDFLCAHGCPVEVCRSWQGGLLPRYADAYSGLVFMGGPMSVNDEKQFPFIRQECLLIEDALQMSVPILGICLGAQLIAKTLGSRVYAGAQKEIGWYPITLTEEGIADPVLITLANQRKAMVFHWHGETFDLPKRAKLLASSKLFPNQAFRYTDRVYALQFHVEIQEHIVSDWLRVNSGELKKAAPAVQPHIIIAHTKKHLAPLRAKTNLFYERLMTSARFLN